MRSRNDFLSLFVLAICVAPASLAAEELKDSLPVQHQVLESSAQSWIVSMRSREVRRTLNPVVVPVMAKKAEVHEVLVVASKTKNYIKTKKLHSSSDVIEALDAKVRALLDDAMERTKSNKRSTVRAADL